MAVLAALVAVAPAAGTSHAGIESRHLEKFTSQEWWVGKDLAAGDMFLYRICDPDTFSALYGIRPSADRCYYASLHFVTLLLGGSGPEWIVQVMLAGVDDGRQYDVYSINAKTVQITGLAGGKEVSRAVQKTVFGLTEFTGKNPKPLIVGEEWGAVDSSASPPIRFMVRDVVIDDDGREVFLAGYSGTNTSIHRITLDKPFPLGAEVYDPHPVHPDADRLYRYDLVWSGNSFSEDFDDRGWLDATGSHGVGGSVPLPRLAPNPGAGVFDFCTPGGLDLHVADESTDLFDELDLPGFWVLDDAAEHADESGMDANLTRTGTNPSGDDATALIDAAESVPDEFAGIAGDETNLVMGGMSAAEYCAALLDSGESVAIRPEPEPEFQTEFGLDMNAGDDLFDDFPEDDFFNDASPEPAVPDDGFDMPVPESARTEFEDAVQPESESGGCLEPCVPDGSAPEHAIPEHAIPEHAIPEHAAPEHAIPEEILEDIPEGDTRMDSISDGTVPGIAPDNIIPNGTVPDGTVPDGYGNILAGIPDGIYGFFDGMMGFLEGIGGMLEGLADIFGTVPAAYAQSGDDTVGRLLEIITGNGTADDIRDGILAEIPNVQDLLESKGDGPVLGVDDSVWIPSKMIVGLEYEGMVLLGNAANEPRKVMLAASDSDIVSVEREVIVQAGRNSAIFEVSAKSGGTAKVYAAMAGEVLLTDGSTVYEINADPYQIMLIAPDTGGAALGQDGAPDDFSLPEDFQIPDGLGLPGVPVPAAGTSTVAGSIPVFAYVLDRNGAPATTNADILLHVGASAGIRVPETVVIPAGADHAKIVAGIDRSGRIHATAHGLRPGVIGIDRAVDDVAVRFAVAPTVIAEGSAAYYYVWLEKAGKPYKPQRVIDVQLTSSDRSVAGFDRAHADLDDSVYGGAGIKDEVVAIQMTGGLARGLVYSGDRGVATLAASVSQYGTAFYGIHVGATSISDAGMCAGEGDAAGGAGPTDMIVWLLPEVTDSVAYAVVAQYHVADSGGQDAGIDPGSGMAGRSSPDGFTPEELQAQALLVRLASLSPGAAGQAHGEEGCVATPVPFAGQFIIVSSDGGAVHERAYGALHPHGIRGAAVEFPIRFLTTGEHAVRVIGNEVGTFAETEDLLGSWTDGAGWEAAVMVDGAYVEGYSLGITALPFDSEGFGEVAVVHLQNGQGSMVETDSIPLRTRDLVVSQTTSDFDVSRYGNVFVLSAHLNRTDGVAVSTAAIAPASRQLAPSDEAVGMHVDVPGAVHVGEEFPYVIHEVNGDGVPLNVAGAPDVSLGDGLAGGSGGRLVAEETGRTGTITVFGVGPPVSEAVRVNENELDFKIDVEAGDVRVGESVLLRLTSDVAGIDYSIAWPSWADYEQVGDNEYEFTPTRSANGSIGVVAGKKGYGTERDSVIVSAVHEVSLSARAEAGGQSIAASPVITRIQDGSEVSVPYVGPPVYVRVAYPVEYVSALGEGYLFTGVEAGGEWDGSPEFEVYVDRDARILGQYERQIFIDIAGAEGSGVYRPGDMVQVRAPDRQKVSFLITETFGHWEGDLSGRGAGSFTLVAEQDLQAAAVYEEVHTVWMGIVLAAAAAAAALSTFYRSDRLKWMLAGLPGLGKTGPRKPAKESGPAEGAGG